MRTPEFVMVHHSSTVDGQTFSTSAIRAFHTSWRIGDKAVSEHEALAARALGRVVEPPWNDIGYHATVELVGTDYEAMIGRPETEQAAACPQGGMNVKALHVCLVGNYDVAVPPQRGLEVLARRVIRPWLIEYGIPVEHIVGHRDYNPAKTCPGKLFNLDAVRGLCR